MKPLTVQNFITEVFKGYIWDFEWALNTKYSFENSEGIWLKYGKNLCKGFKPKVLVRDVFRVKRGSKVASKKKIVKTKCVLVYNSIDNHCTL